MQPHQPSEDAAWRIEIPAGIKQELASLSSRLQEVLDKSEVIEAAISRSPTMADIVPLLERKLEASCASQLEAELDASAEALKASQEATRQALEQRLGTLVADVEGLQRSSALVATFELEYSRLQQETEGMEATLRGIEEHAKQNVDSSDAEVREIHRQFTDLGQEVREMRGRLDVLQARQQEKLSELDSNRRDYQDRFQAMHGEITRARREAEAVARKLPTVISEAREKAEEEVAGMLAKETERRTEENKRLGRQVQALQKELSRAEEEQNDLRTQLKEMREQMEAQVAAALEERTAQLTSAIQTQLSSFATLKDDVLESIDSQRRALKKLEAFSQMFRDADAFWKQNLATLRADAEETLSQMRAKLFDDAQYLRDSATATTERVEKVSRLIEDTSREWDTTWKQREQNVDETLARLYKVVYDIDHSLTSEVATRKEEFTKMSDALETGISRLQALLGAKAGADDVRKALWTKADKIDL